MTTPDEPTEPIDPTEAELRAALDARAASVTPSEPGVDALDGAIAADARHRLRRNRRLMGVAAAAVVIVALALASTLDDPDPDKVVTAATDTTTLATTTTTDGTGKPAETSTTNTAVSSIVTPTDTTMPTTTTTTLPPTTTTSPAVLPGATVDPKAGGGHGAVPALLTDLRIGCNASSDRVVLEFRNGALPSWSVEYVDGLIIEDPTGEVVHVAGNAHLQIRLEGATGYDAQAEQPSYTGPRRVSGGCPGVTEVLDTGDFEGVYHWTVGLGAKAPFSVDTLSAPSRLVIDIAHAP